MGLYCKVFVQSEISNACTVQPGCCDRKKFNEILMPEPEPPLKLIRTDLFPFNMTDLYEKSYK